ncbi:hypothetical protein ACO1O0_000824 [Amphichorda felina]
MTQPRRARAGTVPSRFSPGGAGAGHLAVPGVGHNSARNTPSQSPFNKTPSPGLEAVDSTPGGSALLSRLRAGSMPQRSQLPPLPASNSPFGPSIFSSWNPTSVGRERGSTLASIASVPSNGPSSPSQSQFSREGGNESDVHMRTLDYLGLAETPQPARAQMATPYLPSMNFHKQPSRIRSYSVNNKDVHADEYPEDEYDHDGLAIDNFAALHDQIHDQILKTKAAIHHHNLAVQAFTTQASSTRRRARTAGVLDAPHTHLMSSYFSNSIPGVQSSMGMQDMHMVDEKFEDLSQSVASMNLGRSNSRNAGLLSVEDPALEGPTSALWLGNIPTSTTTTTLTEMFKSHGKILSARVLTHKNCGFVNFERVESAISAKAGMNGKELFPGASPIRINFAKPPSPGTTPGHDGAYPSPSPDPFAKGQDTTQTASAAVPVGDSNVTSAAHNPNHPSNPNVVPTAPPLQEIAGAVMEMVQHFGATDQDRSRISHMLQNALAYTGHISEVPPIREASHARVYDAPKLRELRKRIENQALSVTDIEDAALDMLPEIAELSSDYLGNTVVQKLFEHCSDPVRESMLAKIAPHLAEIGCHKNGTWAAQKIIDVCSTDAQMSMIVEHMRPYAAALFLDQFGNYVVQGCLKYGVPYTDFIFETLLSRIDELSKGRFSARAMRTCLESHRTSPEQQKMLAALIAIHGAYLATDQNGAVLLTWYLDTCQYERRRSVLARRLVPYLVHLCTHKVAYLTVLKLVNQKHDPESREIMMDALFFGPNDMVLEGIVRDTSGCGPTLIFKVLTTPFLDSTLKTRAEETTRNMLLKTDANPSMPGMKRLMEEVGLPTRGGGHGRETGGQSEPRQRPNPRHTSTNGQQGQHGSSGKQFYNQANQKTGYDMGYGQQRNGATDSSMSAFPAFNQGAMAYNASNGGMQPTSMQQQPPFTQSMLGRGTQPGSYNFPTIQGGYGAYGNAGSSVDQFRQIVTDIQAKVAAAIMYAT